MVVDKEIDWYVFDSFLVHILLRYVLTTEKISSIHIFDVLDVADIVVDLWEAFSYEFFSK